MRNVMKIAAIGLPLAACGAGTAVVVQNIFDQVNAITKGLCGFTFVFSTIDAMIKALGGQPVAETIGGILCTQAKALATQNIAPRAAASSEGPAVILVPS